MIARASLFVLFVGVCAVASDTPYAAAQAPLIDREYEIKAHCLCLFGQYIEWPRGTAPGASDEFIIGVLGKDPFDNHLKKAAAGRKVEGKKIVLRHFKTIDEYQPCPILFLAPA